jgi:hypothetical protein
VPLGAAPGPPPAPAQRGDALPPSETEGPNWVVKGGEARRGQPTAWRADGVEALDFNNPFGQIMEKVWFEGQVVYAVDLGKVELDPTLNQVAQEYQPVYAVTLDEHGKLVGEAETIEGQLNIYDTVPGMPGYSPVWQFNYVVVPRTYVLNALRSERDCLSSGYQILRSQVFEN